MLKKPPPFPANVRPKEISGTSRVLKSSKTLACSQKCDDETKRSATHSIDSFQTVVSAMERKESSVSVIISLATSNISHRILRRRSFAGNREAFFSHVSSDGTMGVALL